MNYAIIEEGIVVNIIVLNDDNVQDFPGAVKIGDLPVGIGDTYTDGIFYRDEEEIIPLSEQELLGIE